jgi:hypothetical protein
MVEDVLTLEQRFVDAALHLIVKEVLTRYLGRFALVEAKGWRSLPTRRDFHGWHGDEWYDQNATEEIPKEVKLGFYWTDVRSGAFNYIKGTIAASIRGASARPIYQRCCRRGLPRSLARPARLFSSIPPGYIARAFHSWSRVTWSSSTTMIRRSSSDGTMSNCTATIPCF